MTRSPDARERLIHTGAVLFITRSYRAVGVDELCAAANVRKGSFYHHFTSKSGLVASVIDFHASHILGGLDAISPDADPSSRLYAVAEVVAATQRGLAERFGRVVGCPFGNLAAELSTTDDDIRRHVARVLAEVEARIAEIAQRVADVGGLAQGVTPVNLAREIMTQYHGTILMAKVEASDGHELEPALKAVIDRALRPGVDPCRPAR